MKKRYILKLGIKNIFAHKLRSFLTTTGIAIGVGFIVFLVSLGYGLQRISTKEIANIDALQIIDITPGKSSIIKINDAMLGRIKKEVANAGIVEPQFNVVGNIYFGSGVAEGVIYGKNTEYLKLEGLQMAYGKEYTSNFDRSVMLNQSALKRMGVTESIVGSKVKLKMIIPADRLAEDSKTLVKEEDFTVVGIIKNESSPYAYVPLDAFKEFGVKNYSSAKVKVTDKKYTDLAKSQLESLGFKTVTLKDTVDQINQFFVIFQFILLAFGSIAVIIAILGMFNTLTISLLEKTREISFMKVLGTTSKDIWQLFLTEAIVIGLLGASIGTTFGLLSGNSINSFLINLAQKTGNQPVELFYAPAAFVAAIFAAAVFVSVLTGIYPSARAAKIDPLEALRYE